MWDEEEEDLEDEELDADDEVDVEEGLEAGAGRFVAGLLVGLVAGAAMALLYAPDPGDVTRKRIRRTVRDRSENVGDRLDGWKRQIRRRRARRRRLGTRTARQRGRNGGS